MRHYLTSAEYAVLRVKAIELWLADWNATCDEVARQVGVSVGAVSHWVRADRYLTDTQRRMRQRRDEARECARWRRKGLSFPQVAAAMNNAISADTVRRRLDMLQIMRTEDDGVPTSQCHPCERCGILLERSGIEVGGAVVHEADKGDEKICWMCREELERMEARS